MRFKSIFTAALATSALFASPALAQEVTDPAAAPAAAEPADPITISGGAALVSDYRFRGISQTDRRFALQGNITLKHESGLYGTIWGSSIDDYVAAGADQEIDFVVGFAKNFGGTTFDTGVTYYYYPGSGGGDTDFYEPYVAVSQAFGPVTAKVLAAYAPKQSALTIGNGKEDNLYLAGDLSTTVPGMPITLTGHVGHSFGPSYLTVGDEYTDWSVTAGYAWRNLTFGLAYVDTDATAFSPSGRNITKGGIVASVGVAF
jgi:uncharacterized protein (TIGR02001 family)